MNFKIENNFLNISNYPSIEKHLEEMARKGWLISRIILGSIFIYNFSSAIFKTKLPILARYGLVSIFIQ